LESGRLEALRLLYLYLAAVYSAMAAYTVWSPFWAWAARYVYARGAPGLAATLNVAPYAIAAAAFIAVLAYMPSLSLALVAFGAAVGGVAGATLWLPIVLAIGSSLLYQLATRPGAEARIQPSSMARVLVIEAVFVSASLALASMAGSVLGGLVSLSPPQFLPELAKRAWAALSSTLLGRLLVYGVAVAAVSAAARRLGAQLLALSQPQLAAEEAQRRLLERLTPGPQVLAEALGQASMLSSLVYGAAAAYTAWTLASMLAAKAATATEKALVFGLAAAAAWIAYMASKRLVDYLLLGRPRWGLLAALAAGLLAATAAGVLAYRGPTGLEALLEGSWDPLAELGLEDKLLRLYEGLEAQLRLLVSIIWG